MKNFFTIDVEIDKSADWSISKMQHLIQLYMD